MNQWNEWNEKLNEFERFAVLFSNIRLRGEVIVFVSRSFSEVFYLPSGPTGIGIEP